MSELEKARAKAASDFRCKIERAAENRIREIVREELDAREAKAPLEERIRALELIAFPAVREAKAPALGGPCEILLSEANVTIASIQESNLELLTRAEKAEASLAELRDRAEKAAEELMHISARTGSIPMPEVRHYVLSALTTLAPDHPLLATDPPPPAEDEPPVPGTDIDPEALLAVSSLKVGAFASAVGHLLRVMDHKITDARSAGIGGNDV